MCARERRGARAPTPACAPPKPGICSARHQLKPQHTRHMHAPSVHQNPKEAKDCLFGLRWALVCPVGPRLASLGLFLGLVWASWCLAWAPLRLCGHRWASLGVCRRRWAPLGVFRPPWASVCRCVPLLASLGILSYGCLRFWRLGRGRGLRESFVLRVCPWGLYAEDGKS